MVSPADEFLTVAEIAAILKVNQQTVRNWIDHGVLPALHIGRRVRIKRADFDRLLEASYTAHHAPMTAGTEFRAEDFWSGEPHPEPAVPPRAD